MRIAIIGGTGLIGVALCKSLNERGDELLLISRDSTSARIKNNFTEHYFTWDYKTTKHLTEKINNYNVVINLAGAPIAGRRWNKLYKDLIRKSRINTTHLVADAICACENKPDIFISSSAVGYYGERGEEIIFENSKPGYNFISKLCTDWEEASKLVTRCNVRLVNLRTGIVLAKNGGALNKMLLPFKLFVGGPLGNGRQWFPWIHIEDEINGIIFAIDKSNIKGPINLVSPNPIRMNDFSKKLGKTLNRPSIFRVSKFVLRLVAGKISENLVSSQRIIPQKLLENGFNFKFENVENALEDLLK